MIGKNKKRVAITLDKEVYKLYKKVANLTKNTLSKVINDTLDKYANSFFTPIEKKEFLKDEEYDKSKK